jgi:O-6-methylguanine DNA methyltransferase
MFWTKVNGQLAQGDRLCVYIAAAEGRICNLSMDAGGHPCSEEEFLWRAGRGTKIEKWPQGTGSGLLDAAAMQVEDYIAGRQLEFDLPLSFRGTRFQVDVWKAMTRIPFGETRSYGDVAEMVGRPSAMRAVGQANGKNNLPLIVPCHRVIAAGGKLGGFSGGISLKQALLDHEVAILRRRQMRKAGAA